jgi:glutathione synthase/RimK-type ligase-like ATP-grasp enzyme
MKLARPNVFHPRIVLAGCPQLPSGDGDDAGLVQALRRRGLQARWLSWDHPDVVRADIVVLRATWDYAQRLDEFLAWTTTVPHLLNAPSVVAWNADKRYLLDLARHGVPTVPSTVFAPGEVVRLPGAEEVVVKPATGAGAVGAQRFTSSDAALAHAAALQARGAAVVVQPYDQRVERAGETALVFLGGKPSHAFAKAAILPPQGRQTELDATATYAIETLTPAEPDFEIWDVGFAALAAAAEQLNTSARDFLYARVDVIGDIDDPRLLELELIEPSLGWMQLGEKTRELAQREFARCLASSLERLGLGPLSHRRP